MYYTSTIPYPDWGGSETPLAEWVGRNTPENLWLWGPTGLQKSRSVAHKIHISSKPVRWVDWADFEKAVGGEYGVVSRDFHTYIVKAKVPIIIDDFGSKALNKPLIDATFQLLDYRLKYGLRTWTTSNMSPKQVKEEITRKYSETQAERTYRRIVENFVIRGEHE